MTDESPTSRLMRAMCDSQKHPLTGDLLGGIAHELNNALSVASGYAELLLEKMPAEGGPDALRTDLITIVNWSRTSADVARRLLDFSRRLRADRGQVDIAEIAAEAVELMRYRCERDGIILACDLEPDPLIVDCWPGRVLQTVVHLIQNAREALGKAGEGGTIQVSAKKSAMRALVAVEDDGPGQPEGAQDLFELGVTGRDTPGCGLAVAKTIAGECAGDLRWEASDGGARIVLELPLVV